MGTLKTDHFDTGFRPTTHIPRFGTAGRLQLKKQGEWITILPTTIDCLRDYLQLTEHLGFL